MQQKLFEDKADFIKQYRRACRAKYGKSFDNCRNRERYFVLAELIAEKANDIKAETDTSQMKKVYYFSLEFLIGPLLDNYLLNFGLRDEVAEAVEDMGADLDEILRHEGDPGLGNGGLGRLAACFLDSMAHNGIAGYGNGMRYRYGLFRQEIEGGRQVEKTDNWLSHGYPWETKRSDSAVVVQFGGHVERHESNGRFWFTQEGSEKVLAVPYDVPVVGYGGKTINHLRLWSAEPYEENFDLDASAFMLGKNKKTPADKFFVFYNNPVSQDGAVSSSGDDRTGGNSADGDDETLTVNLDSVAPSIEEIVFIASIYEAEKRRQNFGQVRNAYIRIYNAETNEEIARYDLEEDFSIETVVEFGRLYRRNNEWRFEAMGIGSKNGLESLVAKYMN